MISFALLLIFQPTAALPAQVANRQPDFEIPLPKPTVRQNFECNARLEMLRLTHALTEDALFSQVRARPRHSEKLAAIQMFIHTRRLPPLAELTGLLALDRAHSSRKGELLVRKGSAQAGRGLKIINQHVSAAATIIRAIVDGNLNRALNTAIEINSEMNRECVE